MKVQAPLSATLVASMLFVAQAALADPIGNWRVGEGDAVVRIEACGTEKLCGTIASAAGPAQRDVRNPDRSKRNRPIVGIEVLIDLKKHGADSWTGTSYNAEIGQTFSATVTQKGDDALEVEGCAPGGGNCGKETWTRVPK